jgi:UDP-N-acetylglucosamine 4,6-dehydratase
LLDFGDGLDRRAFKSVLSSIGWPESEFRRHDSRAIERLRNQFAVAARRDILTWVTSCMTGALVERLNGLHSGRRDIKNLPPPNEQGLPVTDIDYSDKTVLITGGTGSFGKKMATRLLNGNVERIRILSRDELKQHEMRIDFADSRMEYHIGDVRNPDSIRRAMQGVDLVFHAAALKQVPSCEFFPLEAVMTNVLGSSNVIEAARQADVQTMVCLSTDKAVMPVNAMGLSKALMEKVAQAAARSATEDGTTICAVRYGNVMYSRGSVIPLFVQQIFEGRPLTVTDPGMTRFLLPLEVAVELVEYAFSHAEPGDTFIRKAPASTMGVLAEAVVRLFEVDTPIETIGVRHGEKIYETLATREELRNSEDHGHYWRLRMDGRGLDYGAYFSEGEQVNIAAESDYHSHNTDRLDVEGTMELLLQLPELKAALDDFAALRGS